MSSPQHEAAPWRLTAEADTEEADVEVVAGGRVSGSPTLLARISARSPRFVPVAVAADRSHQYLAAALVVGVSLPCDLLNQTDRRLRFDPARRHPNHANAFRTDLFRQAFAVIGERGLRRCYYSRTLIEHHRQQSPIEPHCRE